jgi:hypothetical protein
MAYLMEIGFDSSHRLRKKRYLFVYRGIEFKLVQDNPRRHADHLLSIIPTDDDTSRRRVFEIAAEFLSALAWENGARVAVWPSGGRGWRDDARLADAEPCAYTFPKIPFGGTTIGYDLWRIPRITTEEQRQALALFREARASNSAYLSFLFCWQVMEVGGGQPEGYITRSWRRHRDSVRLDPGYIDRLRLGDRSLGYYLREDCRNAIAHITRRPGRRALELDRLDERERLAISTVVVGAFAEMFIRDRLALTELHLVRPRGGGLPVFMDPEELDTRHFVRIRPGRPRIRGIVRVRRRASVRPH